MNLQGSPSKYRKNPNTNSPSPKSGRSINTNGKKLKKQSKRKFCTANFNDFSSCTSLHGVQYLGDNKRSIFERFWWLVMVVLSFATCVYLILRIWKKWNESYIMVTSAEFPTPIWQIPFPAVTICSGIRVRQTAYNYTEAYMKRHSDNLTEEEIFEMESVSMVCNNLFSDGSRFANRSSIEFLKKITQSAKKTIGVCKYEGKDYVPCPNLFLPVFTEEGRCFTFHMLDGKELFTPKMHTDLNDNFHEFTSHGWTIDDGYSENLLNYPLRAFMSKADNGLEVWLITEDDDIDYLCSDGTQGFKITLHSPADFPRVSQKYFMLPVGQEIIATVKPNLITTSTSVMAYDPQRRRCFRSDERQLKYFKIYTQQNCEMECLSNFTYPYCGCVAFWMPRDENTPICSVSRHTCQEAAQINIRHFKIFKESLDLRSFNARELNLSRILTECDCLPGCTSINYDVEVSQLDFRWKELTESRESLQMLNSTVKYSRLRLFFKDSEFSSSKRSELYGVTDFLANCGGVLGLFLGFSFLSLAEIFYFLTIRPLVNLKRSMKNKENVPNP